MNTKPRVIVSGGFDNLNTRHMRFLEESARVGDVTVLLWPDEVVQAQGGKPPKLPLAERLYFLKALRHVSHVVTPATFADINALPETEGFAPEVWVDEEGETSATRQAFCQKRGLKYVALPASKIDGFPPAPPAVATPGRKKVVVTGCYDWIHTGHVRFFEEVSAFGELYVIIGHDANIRLLKGEGHPLFPQEQRLYGVSSIKYVKQALVSSGDGWVDADPEIRLLKPDIYAVNEDGDKESKRDYCKKIGIEYLVLKRTPAPGLSRRSSTDLRGF